MTLPPPRLVTVDFSEKTKQEHGSTPEFSSPEELIRYIAGLETGAGARQGDLGALFQYVLDHGRAVHLYASGFHATSVIAMAEQFRLDMAAAKTPSPLRHGTMSASVSHEDRPEVAAQLLEAGKTLMELLGVDKNRYVLVVHVDTDNVHLHYLYSRIGPDGRIRERESKFPRYQLEEATAVVAFRHDFDLEAGHHCRADEHGVFDLVSNRRTRHADFEIDLDGCRARNKARAALNTGHPLEAVAIAALIQCEGSLERFRELLADAGMGYERCGSGAVLVDAEGRKHKASKVNHRLSRAKVLKACRLGDLPEPSEDLLVRLQARRAQLAADGVPSSIQNLEWKRFADDRLGRVDYSPVDKHLANKWDADVQRCFNEERRGRPQKGPRPAYWPKKVTFEGALGSPGWRRSPMTHFPLSYDVHDRRWQTEVWRSGELIATIRYSRMVITSNKEEDLRAALIAAHKAWGRVEVFGNRKFKRQIVALAAELNIPLSNNELQRPLKNARAKVVAGEPTPASSLLAPSTAEIEATATIITAPTRAASGAAIPSSIKADRVDAKKRSEVADKGAVTAAHANLACEVKGDARLASQTPAAAAPTNGRADVNSQHRDDSDSANHTGVASGAEPKPSPVPTHVRDFVRECVASGRPLHFPKGADGPALPLSFRQFRIEESDLLRPEVQRALRPTAIKQAQEIRNLINQLEREKVVVVRTTARFGSGDVRFGVASGAPPTLVAQVKALSSHPTLQDALARVHKRQEHERLAEVPLLPPSSGMRQPTATMTRPENDLSGIAPSKGALPTEAEASPVATLRRSGDTPKHGQSLPNSAADEKAATQATAAKADEEKDKAVAGLSGEGTDEPPYLALLSQAEIDEIREGRPKALPYESAPRSPQRPAPAPPEEPSIVPAPKTVPMIKQEAERSSMVGKHREAEPTDSGSTVTSAREISPAARQALEQQKGSGIGG